MIRFLSLSRDIVKPSNLITNTGWYDLLAHTDESNALITISRLSNFSFKWYIIGKTSMLLCALESGFTDICRNLAGLNGTYRHIRWNSETRVVDIGVWGVSLDCDMVGNIRIQVLLSIAQLSKPVYILFCTQWELNVSSDWGPAKHDGKIINPHQVTDCWYSCSSTRVSKSYCKPNQPLWDDTYRWHEV